MKIFEALRRCVKSISRHDIGGESGVCIDSGPMLEVN